MLQQQHSLSLRPLPSLHMQQGLHMLHAPITELSSYLLEQITLNPFFDLSSVEEDEWQPTLTASSSVDERYSRPETLLSHLLTQIQHAFSTHQEQHIAQYIVGNLSEHGLLTMPIDEIAEQLDVPEENVIAIRKQIQSFHPLGIASSSLQEYWLFCLQSSPHQLAYQIIKEHYPLLINCHFQRIAKKYRCSPEHLKKTLKQAFTTIPWSPAERYKTRTVQPALPDIYLHHVQGQWDIQISNRGLPPIQLNRELLTLYDQLPKQEKQPLKQHILSAKWLVKNLRKREQTLLAVMQKVLAHQEPFLLGNTNHPSPLSVKNLAQELGFHESTLFRAIEHKALSTPKHGILPLKHLFPQTTDNGVTRETILQWIHQWITSEEAPLSDAAISQRIAEKGISCARRTVAKYRAQLKILPAHKR